MVAAVNPREERRAPREEVLVRTVVTIAGGRATRAIIANISPLGCLLRCDAPAQIFDDIVVAMPIVGTISGHVVWCAMGRIGIEFVEPVAPTIYPNLLEKLHNHD